MFMSANVTSNGVVVPIRSNYQSAKISLGHGGDNSYTSGSWSSQHSSESTLIKSSHLHHLHLPSHHHHHHHPQPQPQPPYPEYPLVMSVIPESITATTTTTTSGPGEQQLCPSMVTSSSIPDQSRSNSVNGRVNDVTLGHDKNKDTTLTKIFVGGLPYHTTDKSLRKFFETFGEIEEAVVITDRQTGKSRGYGFVTMADREAAERAVKHANPIIDGRKANVNLAYLGAKPRGSNSSSGLSFPVRGGYHPVIPNSQFGLAPNAGSYMYHPVATASPFISGAPLLLPQSGTYFEFAPPSGATFAALPAPAQFVNGFAGYPHHHHHHHPQVAPSTSAAATGPANASPFTANTFIPVEGRMQ